MVLLPYNSTDLNITGDKKRAAGYYGYASGMHTVSMSLNNFTGRIYIQGSLIDNPTENDWFNIQLNNNSYIQYNNQTLTDSYTFLVNMTWIRVKIDRTYLDPQPLNVSEVGFIRKILVNY